MRAIAEVRCTARHPKVPHWECRKKLADVVPGTVLITKGGKIEPGCTGLKCPRCGAEYVTRPKIDVTVPVPI